MPVKKPHSLQKGDTIGIVATARWLAPEKLQKAVHFLESKGFKVKTHPNNALRLHEWAGSPKERAKAFEEYWCDPEIKCIITAAGGTRTLHLLDELDYKKMAEHSKILMGFSDTTALLNALLTKINIAGFHGPDANRFAGDNAETYFKDFIAMATKDESAKETYLWDEAKVIHYGSGEGQLIGGNLCIFNYLLGTQYAPSFKNKIIFIEDEMEELRNIDRMLLQLKRLGKLDEAAGLIVGGFTMTLNTGRKEFPYSVDELIEEHTEGLNIPVITNAPFGHGKQLQILPLGVRAKIKTENGKVHFRITEDAVKK